jgi:hypothetical protein
MIDEINQSIEVGDVKPNTNMVMNELNDQRGEWTAEQWRQRQTSASEKQMSEYCMTNQSE